MLPEKNLAYPGRATAVAMKQQSEPLLLLGSRRACLC